MEVKINREIRNYTENMFFGLSMRQFIFSVLTCGAAVALYFGLRDALGTETAGRGSVCRAGICPLSRDDCGKADLDVGEIRVPAPQTALVPAGQPLV